MAAVPADMNQFLEHVIGITDDAQRDRLVQAGLGVGLERLVGRSLDYTTKVCSAVRRQAGNSSSKNVPVSVEEDLLKFHHTVIHIYLVQRTLADYSLLTMDNINTVGDWRLELAKSSPTEHGLVKFSEGINKKNWFESIVEYLAMAVGPSGAPLVYVIRERVALPADDPGFTLPTLDDEMRTRGRQDGTLWRADNKTVWILMKEVTEGTTAWTSIKSFSRANNGKAAFSALHKIWMGDSMTLLLRKRAELTLNHAVYDGKHKSWTFPKHVGKLQEAFQDMA